MKSLEQYASEGLAVVTFDFAQGRAVALHGWEKAVLPIGYRAEGEVHPSGCGTVVPFNQLPDTLGWHVA